MDVVENTVEPAVTGALSYDDSVPYEEQVPTTEPMTDAMEDTGSGPSLAGRIGTAKLYLMSETSVAKSALKRKLEEDYGMGEEPAVAAEDVTDEFDPDRRANAIFFSGPPISHLPTARLFAYAKHFDVTPMGLEWINDNSCIFVFPSKSLARSSYTLLCKSASEAPDEEEFVTAKSIPIEMWPAEDRINSSLGKGQGLKGTIRMRWARVGDVKKKQAGKESEFYRKHGKMAGKEVDGGEGVPPAKRRRQEPGVENGLNEAQQKALLDAELDQFLAEEDEDGEKGPGEPPSKMRADYIEEGGRTERLDLASRITAPIPRRSRDGDLAARISSPHGDRPGSRRGGRRGERERERRGDRDSGRRERRKPATQEDLDKELDDFLNGRN